MNKSLQQAAELYHTMFPQSNFWRISTESQRNWEQGVKNLLVKQRYEWDDITKDYEPDFNIRLFCDAVRQRGRTTKMIMDIPVETKVLIIVHSYKYEHDLKCLISEKRPELNLADIHFYSIQQYFKEDFNRLRGHGFEKLYIDNAVTDTVMFDFIKKVTHDLKCLGVLR